MTMQMTEIRRQSFGVITKLDGVMVELAEQAKELLGYDVLEKHTKGVARSAQAELTEIQQALLDLDIEILNPMDVLRYQEEIWLERTAELCKEWLAEQTGQVQSGRRERINSWDGFRGPSWTSEEIRDYSKPIPEFVLAKAVQIKQRLPECQLKVYWLENHPDPFLAVMTQTEAYHTPKELYWVEVWDEPKFEGRLRTAAAVDGDDGIPF